MSNKTFESRQSFRLFLYNFLCYISLIESTLACIGDDFCYYNFYFVIDDKYFNNSRLYRNILSKIFLEKKVSEEQKGKSQSFGDEINNSSSLPYCLSLIPVISFTIMFIRICNSNMC